MLLNSPFSTFLWLRGPISPGFDHGRVGCLRLCHKLHLSMSDFLDPVIAGGTSGPMCFGSAGTKFKLAHLHGDKGGPSPSVGSLLGQQLPSARGATDAVSSTSSIGAVLPSAVAINRSSSASSNCSISRSIFSDDLPKTCFSAWRCVAAVFGLTGRAPATSPTSSHYPPAKRQSLP